MKHDKIPGHFEEKFERTFGHPIQKGNLKTPIQNFAKNTREA